MALATTVLVNGITNLSDARYVAGMGAEILSFPVDPSLEASLSENSLKEIVSWVSGPKIAVEVEDEKVFDSASFDADMVLTSNLELLEKSDDDTPIIFRLDLGSAPDAQLLNKVAKKVLTVSNLSYLLVEADSEDLPADIIEALEVLSASGKVLLGFGFDGQNIIRILDEAKPAGISLKGSEEIKPGYKDFDDLADVLEAIELDD